MPIYTGPIDNLLGSRDINWKPGPTAPDSIKNRDFYTMYDEETGETQIKERNLLDPLGATDTYIGKWDKNKKFIPVKDLLTQKPVDAPPQQYFASPNGTKVGLRQSELASKKDLVDNGSKATGFKPVSENEANKLTNNISNPNKALTEDDTNTTETDDIKSVKEGTKLEFEDLIYPISLNEETQDIIKIKMLKYIPRGLNSTKARPKLGDRMSDGQIREEIGQVILPIPGGIKDSDNVNWGGDNLNDIKLALAQLASKAILEGPGGASNELSAIGKKFGENKLDLKKATVAAFASAAIGKDFKTLMQRQEGAVLNPNMELLFDGPTLRPFAFNFLLAPRSKSESEMVMKIIRFFKQGMAPIRTGGHLFLRSPHTFQLAYMNRDETHKYLNSFKECALKTCEVNYTPEQNYSTYEDGVMTAYTMSLQFQELEPVFNDDYGDEKDVAHLNFIN